MEVYQLDVFTQTPGEGNPAGIVPEALEGDEELFGAVARQLSLETAFILKTQTAGPSPTFQLRYFAPNGQEMNLCAHATLGALYLLATKGMCKKSCQVLTLAGLFSASAEMEKGEVTKVKLQLPRPVLSEEVFNLEVK